MDLLSIYYLIFFIFTMLMCAWRGLFKSLFHLGVLLGAALLAYLFTKNLADFFMANDLYKTIVNFIRSQIVSLNSSADTEILTSMFTESFVKPYFPVPEALWPNLWALIKSNIPASLTLVPADVIATSLSQLLVVGISAGIIFGGITGVGYLILDIIFGIKAIKRIKKAIKHSPLAILWHLLGLVVGAVTAAIMLYFTSLEIQAMAPVLYSGITDISVLNQAHVADPSYQSFANFFLNNLTLYDFFYKILGVI